MLASTSYNEIGDGKVLHRESPEGVKELSFTTCNSVWVLTSIYVSMHEDDRVVYNRGL